MILIGVFAGAAVGSFIGEDDRLKLAVTVEKNTDLQGSACAVRSEWR